MIRSRAICNRAGFTLIELMMAAALALVIMTVLAVAFRSGMDTMSQMKSVAGLAGQLRSVTNILRSDLDAQHLEDNATGLPVAVSDPQVSAAAWSAPKRGFFRVTAPNRTTDGSVEGMNTYRCTDHSLHFTTKRAGANAAEVFRAKAPANVFSAPGMQIGLSTGEGTVATQWAEISYFLWRSPSGPKTEGNLDLYTLYRRERLIAPADLTSVTGLDPNAYPDLSISGGKVNTPETVTALAARPNPTTPLPAGDYQGSDILLSNVLSFQIDCSVDGDDTYRPFGSAPPLSNPVTAWDTETAAKPQLRSISIKIRVYDPKNRIIRQMTLNQAL